MSGLHLYCIAPSGTFPPDDLTGAGGGAVETVPVGNLLLWVERTAPLPPSGVDVLERHHEVIAAAAAAGPCLPIRFGSRFADEDALRNGFREKEIELLEGLRRVGGCREFGVLVMDEPGASRIGATGGTGASGSGVSGGGEVEGEKVSAGAAGAERAEEAAGGEEARERPGTRHLLALAHREERAEERARRAEALSREVESEVGDLLRAVRWEPLPPDRGLVALAHLVPDASVDEYRSRIRRWTGRRANLRAVQTGPWPPYSFTP